MSRIKETMNKGRLGTFLFSDTTSLQERLFLLAGIVGSGAVLAVAIVTAAANQGLLVSGVLFLAFVIVATCTFLARRTKRTTLYGSVIVIMCLAFVFPVGYLLGGGADSGTPIWFTIIVLFIAAVFPNKLFWVYTALAVVEFAVLTYVSAMRPELVTPLGEGLIYIDTFVSGTIVALLVATLMRYQNAMVSRENAITREQKAEIESLADAQSRFFSSMSHEIRTPLNTIIGLNEMTLRDTQISEEVAENASNIQNASRILLALINDVLDLSKIESGRMELAESQYETSRMLSDVVNLLWARAKEKGLRFEVNVGEGIPSMLYGDEMRIKQVVINVLTNAIKYTEEGSVTLTVDGEIRGSNEFILRVDVDDTGIGIRKEALPYLFDSFRRVDTERNKNVEGTGLGLAISKQLMDLMGGTITVDSIFTKGSHFQIEVPQRIVDADPMRYTSIADRSTSPTGAYENIFEAPDAHVLIVDDNDMNRMVSRKLLRGTRVHADVAGSGQECLERTANVRYDVIFMDHEMPDMDGIETLHALREQDGGLCKNTPVIALTANAGSDMNAFYLNQGFQAYLAKPIHGSLLEATLLQFLPPELVERSVQATEEDRIAVASSRRKRAVAVTVDCPCDVPDAMLAEAGVVRMPFYIITEAGRFRDVEEIDADNLFGHFEDGGRAQTSPASVEEYERFFGNALDNAETVVHVSMSSRVSEAYSQAMAAAASFGNVHVVDSCQFSSGLGLVALEAARLAAGGANAEEVVELLVPFIDRVETTVLVSSLYSPIIRIGMPAPVRALIKVLSWEPVFRLSPRGMRLAGFHGGYVSEAPDKYIRSAMRRANRVGEGTLFCAYAGLNLQEQEQITHMVTKRAEKFDAVVMQKASATVAANTWMQSFGIMYIRKGNR